MASVAHKNPLDDFTSYIFLQVVLDNIGVKRNNKIVDNQPTNTQPTQSQGTPQKSSGRILVVEDEKDYRDILTERLETEGFTVLKAENGQLALNLMKNTEVDLILLDMLMPQMDGTTFFYHLKNTLKKEIPVIILTNFTEMAYPEGVTDYVVKANASLDEVVEKIKNNLPVKT